jgi:hypothetical protein
MVIRRVWTTKFATIICMGVGALFLSSFWLPGCPTENSSELAILSSALAKYWTEYGHYPENLEDVIGAVDRILQGPCVVRAMGERIYRVKLPVGGRIREFEVEYAVDERGDLELFRPVREHVGNATGIGCTGGH